MESAFPAPSRRNRCSIGRRFPSLFKRLAAASCLLGFWGQGQAIGAQREDPLYFSRPAGFYPELFFLELESDAPAAVIHYTLDGSEPTTRAPVYTAPLPLTRSVVVRARSFTADQASSPLVTNTYFIGQRHSLAVVSLATDPANLWDGQTGIYVLGDEYSEKYPFAGANIWQEWEIPVHCEFFEPEGSRGFNMDLGMRIQGASSRIYSQKSLALFARKKYSQGKIAYRLFPAYPIDEFEAIVLRNSGSDWGVSMIRDALTAALVQEMGVKAQAYRPAVVFINGEYWGIHNIREKINEHFIADHFGVDAETIEFLEEAGTPIQGDSTHYRDMIQFVETNDLRLEEHFAQVEAAMDVENFMDYYAIQIYIGNNDWPGKNIKFWRQSTPAGKWRWLLFDTDFGFARFNQTPHNMLAYVARPDSASRSPGRNPLWSTLLFRRLLENQGFKERFAGRLADFMNVAFRSDRAIAAIRSMRRVLEAEMPAHYERWARPDFAPGLPEHLRHQGSLVERWEQNVQVVVNFASQRGNHIIRHVQEVLGAGEAIGLNLEVAPPGVGSIRVNRRFAVDAPWRGRYFAGLPIQLQAVSKGNFNFDGWEGLDETAADLSFRPQGDQRIVARFVHTVGAAGSVVINEINYHSPADFEPEDWVEIYNNANVAIDLSGWTFSDGGEGHVFALPQGTFIKAGQYLVLCRKKAAFLAHFPQVGSCIGDFGFGLDNAGEALRLADGRGNIIDRLDYANVLPWPPQADGQGATLALKSEGLDNARGANWVQAPQNGTPGRVNKRMAPRSFFSDQNYPNPFNATTRFAYGLARPAQVRIVIYDLLGQAVAEFDLGRIEAGFYHLDFDGGGLASGLYLYRFEADNFARTHKMVLLK